MQTDDSSFYDDTTIAEIINRLESKVKRQQTNLTTTTMELEHWRAIRTKKTGALPK